MQQNSKRSSNRRAGNDVYFQIVQQLLIDFQFIEESLKMYLSHCFRIIRSNLDSRVRYKFGRRDVQNLPLGKLISMFRKFSQNDVLISKLSHLPKQRNFVAHQAFLHTREEQQNADFIDSEIQKLDDLQKETSDCVGELITELKKVQNRV